MKASVAPKISLQYVININIADKIKEELFFSFYNTHFIVFC